MYIYIYIYIYIYTYIHAYDQCWCFAVDCSTDPNTIMDALRERMSGSNATGLLCLTNQCLDGRSLDTGNKAITTTTGTTQRILTTTEINTISNHSDNDTTKAVHAKWSFD